MQKNKVAKELLVIARSLVADNDDEADVVDPKFNEKIRTLRQSLVKISQKKRRRLQQYGIGLIRPNATVETLVDALLRVTTG